MNVTPNFNFGGNCAQAIRLYEKAFGTKASFILHYRDADPRDWSRPLSEAQAGWVYHAEMDIGGHRFMFSDIIDFEVHFGNASFLTLTFHTKEEVMSAFETLAPGGQILVPPHATTYSSCAATLIDPLGIRWGLMTEQTAR